MEKPCIISKLKLSTFVHCFVFIKIIVINLQSNDYGQFVRFHVGKTSKTTSVWKSTHLALLALFSRLPGWKENKCEELTLFPNDSTRRECSDRTKHLQSSAFRLLPFISENDNFRQAFLSVIDIGPRDWALMNCGRESQGAPSWVGWGAVMYRRCLAQPTTGHEKKSSHLHLTKFPLRIDDRHRPIIYSFWEEQPQKNECIETRPVPTRQPLQSLQACWARGNRTRAGLN